MRTTIITILGLALCGRLAMAEQPHMERALEHLGRAEAELEAAKANKAGHRERALEQIRKAKDEVRQGMQAAGGGGSTGQVQLDDLVGMRAGSLDTAMGERGFRNTGGYQRGGAAYATWYNAGKHQCVEVETRDGRVAAIKSIVEGNCQ